MNRYAYPRFKRPEIEDWDFMVGSHVIINFRGIQEAREMGNIPASNIGVVVKIEHAQHLALHVRHNGEDMIRRWSYADVRHHE